VRLEARMRVHKRGQSWFKTLWEIARNYPHASAAALLFLLSAGTVIVADRWATSSTASEMIVDPRPALAAELTKWQYEQCGVGEQGGGGGRPRPGRRSYLGAAEGGGIRAAYWTALELASLHELDPEFDRSTFAISGISGGSVGATVYTVCAREEKDVAGIRR